MKEFFAALSKIATIQVQVERVALHVLHEKQGIVQAAERFYDLYLGKVRSPQCSHIVTEVALHNHSIAAVYYMCTYSIKDESDPLFGEWTQLMYRAQQCMVAYAEVYEALNEIEARG